ncbi:hypothetical protein GLOIN_2v1785965 [Rhizophagus clarus]|uniref:Uncharacterized protein n=1 Tax=Rhizophagus clarus TaxID=94130 RepID=A0A8H3R610_9GLOM|nr:hypothetical protein GLOIN_2v1785965 [Rhizophagus clarus]
MAVCLGNKNLAGILWLGRLLERWDIEAKNSFIATDHNKTITNSYTNHAIDLYNDALPNITQEDTRIGQQDAIVAQHIIERQDNHNSVNAIEIQQLESPVTLPVQQAPSNNINKRKKRYQKSATTNEATSNDTHNTTLRAHTVTKMEDVIAIPSAVDSKPTFVNDLINLEGNLEHSGHDNAYTSITHARHNAYLQELRSLAEDTIMTEANEECAIPEWCEPAPDPQHDIIRDYTSPNCIDHLDNLKITCDTKDQDNLHLAPDLINNPEKFFTPSHFFLPNVYNVDKDRDENEFEMIKDDKGFWRTQKRPPKNLIKTLSTIKTDEKEKAKDNTSIHEKREDNFTTYDAYISLNDIDYYFHNDAKLAYIEMLARDLKGFAGTEISRGDQEILVKNTTYKGMLHISGIKPFKNNQGAVTVFVTIKDTDIRKLLKHTWSIEINNHYYRFAPVHCSDLDLSPRKQFRGEFVGFDEHIASTIVHEAYVAQNPKHIFRQSNDKFIIEFENKADLFNACDKTVHFRDYVIKGSPCNYAINWIDRKARIAKWLPEIKPQENIVKLTQDDHSQHARITYEE